MRNVTYAATRSAERSRRKQSGAPTANAPRIHGARVARRPWPGFGRGFGFGFQGQGQGQGSMCLAWTVAPKDMATSGSTPPTTMR